MLLRGIKTDDEGFEQWCFGHGLSDYKQNINAIEQDIYCRLKEFKFDCFWSIESGIDWRTRLGYYNQKDLLDSDVQQRIDDTTGVLYIDNFTSTMNGRKYTCQCDVYTIYSTDSITLNWETA